MRVHPIAVNRLIAFPGSLLLTRPRGAVWRAFLYPSPALYAGMALESLMDVASGAAWRWNRLLRRMQRW